MVIHYPFFGGPHNQALRLRAPLEALGFETTVLLPAEPGNAADRLRDGGVSVLEVPLHRLRASTRLSVHIRFALNFLKDIRTIRRVIRHLKPDVVEVNGLVNTQAAIAGRLERVPVVWQLLDTRPPMILRRLLMPIVRRLSGSVMSTGVAVSEVHPGAEKLGARLISFFPPVDVFEFRPDAVRTASARAELGLRSDDPVIGTLANLTPQKGLEYFLEAARLVKVSRPGAQFVILGRPMETQNAYASMICAGADGLAIVSDPGNRIAELLPALDVFALTSVPRSEGISTTVLEAMACGIPVVATDVGALREAVMDGETGFIVPASDPIALASAIESLLADVDQQRRFGEAARQRAVTFFDAKTCAMTHVQAFNMAIEHQ